MPYKNQKQILESNFLEEEYKKLDIVFIENSTQLNDLVNFIVKKILPNLKLKRSLLDIGAGPGHITATLSKHFSTTTIIEPNEKYHPLYDKNHEAYKANFQDVMLANKYDLVLCSHMFYYIDPPTREKYMRKLYNLTADDGICLLITVAPRGTWGDLLRSVSSTTLNSFHIEEILKKMCIPYQVTPISSIFQTTDHQSFRDLLHLFAIENGFPQKGFEKLEKWQQQLIRQKIDAYADKCKTTNGSYMLVAEDDYIVLKKHSPIKSLRTQDS